MEQGLNARGGVPALPVALVTQRSGLMSKITWHLSGGAFAFFNKYIIFRIGFAACAFISNLLDLDIKKDDRIRFPYAFSKLGDLQAAANVSFLAGFPYYQRTHTGCNVGPQFRILVENSTP